MLKFKAGDIVAVKGLENVFFSVESVVDYDWIHYRLVKICPVDNAIISEVVNENDIEIVFEENNTPDYLTVMCMLNDAYEEMGYGGIYNFIEVATQSENDYRDFNKARNEKGATKVKNNNITYAGTKDRIVRYSMIQTIDECLDVMNDLAGLYEMFGDEDYLKSYEIVVKRIGELNKKKGG
jgi:hypothetical protein